MSSWHSAKMIFNVMFLLSLVMASTLVSFGEARRLDEKPKVGEENGNTAKMEDHSGTKAKENKLSDQKFFFGNFPLPFVPPLPTIPFLPPVPGLPDDAVLQRKGVALVPSPHSAPVFLCLWPDTEMKHAEDDFSNMKSPRLTNKSSWLSDTPLARSPSIKTDHDMVDCDVDTSLHL